MRGVSGSTSTANRLSTNTADALVAAELADVSENCATDRTLLQFYPEIVRMSTERDGNDDGPTPPTHITLELSEDGDVWIVTDEETGVTTQGETREEALEMLDEAVALHKGEAGKAVTDDDLREWGIDPETVSDEAGVPDAPWFDADAE